jgi:hypothetical protein
MDDGTSSINKEIWLNFKRRFFEGPLSMHWLPRELVDR